MLDVVFGTSPFVTSSHTIPASAFVGLGVPLCAYRKTIGVAKVIMSRVGRGPFPSELGGAESERYCNQDWAVNAKEFESKLPISDSFESEFDLGRAVRVATNEYGSGTGRPRRVGCLDLFQLQYACKLCGVDELALNKLDQIICSRPETPDLCPSLMDTQ